MIPATGIQDQELPIAAKRARVNNPTVTWRGNLCTGPVPMDSPFWVPPAPLVAPNSRIRAPFTGKRRCPRVSAKAMAGARRPGSLSAARLGRVASSSMPRAATRAERVALSRPCSSLAMRSLRLSTWRARSVACCRSLSSACSATLCFFLPLVDQHVHAQLLVRKQIQVAGEALAFGVDILTPRVKDRRDRRRGRRPVPAFPEPRRQA